MFDVECAWVAGLIEGEGSFTFAGGTTKSGRRFPQIQCGMTDEDVIRKLHRLTGCGGVSVSDSNRKQNPDYKLMYCWIVTRREDVESVLVQIRPHMGDRRRARLDELLAYFDENPPVHPAWIPHGVRLRYSRGCRCRLCKGAEAKYRRELKVRNASVQAA